MSTGGFRKSEAWHSELLEAMERGDGLARPLLSSELAGTLKMYLQFRHRFRILYGFELDWDRMRPLAIRMKQTMDEFGAAVRRTPSGPSIIRLAILIAA